MHYKKEGNQSQSNRLLTQRVRTSQESMEKQCGSLQWDTEQRLDAGFSPSSFLSCQSQAPEGLCIIAFLACVFRPFGIDVKS